MGYTPLGGCVTSFLKKLYSNIRFHIKDSKLGRKFIFMNCTCCNGSPQKITFQFANGKLPHPRCRAFWALSCFQLMMLNSSNLILIFQVHFIQHSNLIIGSFGLYETQSISFIVRIVVSRIEFMFVTGNKPCQFVCIFPLDS